MATITILSRALIPATSLQPERVKIGISSANATLIQSSPNDLVLKYDVWFGVPNYTVTVNSLYQSQPLPPYNNYWFIVQEGADWFIYFNVNPYTYTSFISYTGWQSFEFPYSIPPADPNFITISSQPGSFMPVYNPIVFTFTSPKYNEIGYRYLVDIKDSGNNLINRLKLIPRPDGYGYVDIQKILSNFLSYDFQPGRNLNNNCSKSYFKYKVSLGDEYLSSWKYTNFVKQVGGLYDGYVVLNQTNTAIVHTYAPGDQITIDTDTSGLAQNVGGLHSVVLVPNQYQVVIDVIYPNNDPSIAIPGTTRYSDNRKTGYSNLTTIDNLIVYNGVFSWRDWKGYNQNRYIVDYKQYNHLLTSIKPTKPNVSVHNRYYFDTNQEYYINYATLELKEFWLYVEDSFGNQSYNHLYEFLNGEVRQFKISYDILINDYEINPNSEWVKFLLMDEDYKYNSDTYTIFFDRRCSINDVYIYFTDKLGSILSIPFQLRVNESITVDRSVSKVSKDFSNRLSLDLLSGGDTINHISSKKIYELNTNWMNDSQMELFEIMMESPNTWISINGEELQSCIIEDTSLEINKYKNKSLFRKSVKVRLSNQNPLNI